MKFSKWLFPLAVSLYDWSNVINRKEKKRVEGLLSVAVGWKVNLL